MRQQIWIGLLAGALALATPLQLSADSIDGGEVDIGKQPFDIVADEVEYDGRRKVYVGRGNVRITQGDRTLTADRVFFSNDTRIGVATGDVVITQGEDTVTSDFIQFSTESLLGVAFGARLDAADSLYEMSGGEIEKTGDDTYILTDGVFTTCRCPDKDSRRPWVVTAEDTDIDVEGSATVRNARAEILGVPVLWLPWGRLPVKQERQSGFLFPEMGISDRTGGDVTLPFFWAAHEQVGVTLFPEWTRKRGWRGGAEVEYVFGERDGGTLYGSYSHDTGRTDDELDVGIDKNRWGISWEHFQDLPADFGARVDFAWVSDNEYPFDFDDFREFRRDRFLESAGFLTGPFGPSKRFATSLATQIADDLQNPADQDRDKFLLQRMPDLRLAALPGHLPRIPGLVVGSNFRYTRLVPFDNQENELDEAWRFGTQFYDTGAEAIENGEERLPSGVTLPLRDPPVLIPGTDIPQSTFDASRDDFISEGNSLFEEGEPLADRGHRVLAHPRLSYPTRVGDLVELTPSVGYYGTFYDTKLQENEFRHLITGRVDLRTRANGVVGMPGVKGKVVHNVEPFATYVYVSSVDQDDDPLLVPETAVPQVRLRMLEPDNVILDPADRIERANQVLIGVNNRWMGENSGKVYGELTLLGGYDIAHSQWSPIVLDGNLGPVGDARFAYQLVYDIHSNRITDGMFSFGWANDSGHRAGVEYRYVRDLPLVYENFKFDDRFKEFKEGFDRINQLTLGGRLQLGSRIGLTYRGNYSFKESIGLYHQLGFEFVSGCRCWAVRLEGEHDRTRGYGFNFQYRIFGLGQDPAKAFARARGEKSILDRF